MKNSFILLFCVILLSFTPFDKAETPKIILFYKGKAIKNNAKINFKKLESTDLTLGFSAYKDENKTYFIEGIELDIKNQKGVWERVGGTICLDKDISVPMAIPIPPSCTSVPMSKSNGFAIQVQAIYSQQAGEAKMPIANSGTRFELFPK